MPEEVQRNNVGTDGKTWGQWKRELSRAIEELDKACSHARQLIYQMRPLLRPKNAAATSPHDEDETALPPVVPLHERRQARRGRRAAASTDD